LLDQLLANQGKKVVVELINGRKISGTVLSANQQFVRLETDEGIGNIPVQAVYIVWETPAQTLTRENMDEIAEKLRDSVKAHIACTSFPGFTCSQSYICRPPDTCTYNFSCPGSYVPGACGPFQFGAQCNIPGGFVCAGTQFYGIVGPQGQPMAGQFGQDDVKAQIACTAFPGFTCTRSYICRPPDTCTFSFACPGSYVPSFPAGGGGCPFFACGPFQFGQPCTFAFQCGPFQFGQPCTFAFQCGPFQFGQPCGPFTFGCSPFVFGQPCSPFVFGQPCSPFVFGGSQCGIPGGFVCPGQQFIGAVGPPGGLPGKPMGATTKQKNPPLSPLDFSVKKEDQSDENKVKKE